MKRLVIGTTNKNKVKRLKNLLRDFEYNIVSLEEYGNNIGEPKEVANTPVGIAIDKALYYAEKLPTNTLILTQDDTIKFENINKEDDPGLHIKEPVIKKYGKFTDENASKYYKDLAKKYGGTIPMTFNYGHAVAIKTEDSDRNMIKVIGGSSKLCVRLVDRIHNLESVKGYFLGALTEVNIEGKWMPYNDLDDDTLVKLDNDLYLSITKLLNSI